MSKLFDGQPVFAARWKRTRARWPQEHAPPCIGSPGSATWWRSLELMNILVGEKRNLVVDPAKISATITTRRSHHTQHLGHICEEIFESTVIYPNILKMTTMVLYIIIMMMMMMVMVVLIIIMQNILKICSHRVPWEESWCSAKFFLSSGHRVHFVPRVRRQGEPSEK